MPTSTIVIYFHASVPFDDELYRSSYRDFSAYAAEQGLRILFALEDSYQGQMQFQTVWEFSGDDFVQVNAPVTADLIYDKSGFGALKATAGDLIVNLPEFDALARDKWTTYDLLRDFCPLTFTITNDNWQEVADRIPTDRIVLKPRLGYGGVGVHIATKADFDFPSLNLTEPYIAQEFIDSSAGIPGICEGYHDLRVLLFNGVPTLSFVRTPKPGSLLSNVAQGGTAFPVDIAFVPEAILQAAKQIDQHFDQFSPRFYSSDFFIGSSGRPYLIETNTQPGFPHAETEGETFTQRYYAELCALFKAAIHP